MHLTFNPRPRLVHMQVGTRRERMLPLNKGARYVFHSWVHLVEWILEHGPVPTWWNFVTERWAGILKSGLHSFKSLELGIMLNYLRHFRLVVANYSAESTVSDRDAAVVVSSTSKTTVDLSAGLLYATEESKLKGDDDIAAQLHSFRERQGEHLSPDVIASGVNNIATFHARAKTNGILRRVWETDQKFKSRSSFFIVGEGEAANQPLLCRLEKIVRWKPYLSEQCPVWSLYIASYFTVLEAEDSLGFTLVRLKHDHNYHKHDRVDHMHTMFNSNLVLVPTRKAGPGAKMYALTVQRNEKVDQAGR